MIAIIGGGAAGMMAAIVAGQNGAKVTILEKNEILGKKILISGKGRCNITNFCGPKEVIANTPTNSRFLYNSLFQFNSFDVVDFFNRNGLETKIERGNRVFPVSDNAADVVKILAAKLKKIDVTIIHQTAKDILKVGKIFAVKLANGEVLRAEKLIIATGGKSYPGTGSTGDGYKFSRKFGHKINKFKPSLVPIETTEKWVTELQGLSLKNASIKIYDANNKMVYDDFGEMLFTHFGVSGPLILSASSHLRRIENHKLIIDLKPALTEEKLDIRIQRDFAENPKKQFETVLKLFLPKKMIPIFIKFTEISAKKQVNQISKTERKRLLYLFKNLEIKLSKLRSIKEAIITSGGVDVKEINPKTMESKIEKNLFFAGEIIDVDAYTGGFNLQIAWSTGFVAGKSASS
ncbi:MAG: NAD(P)/FAD-dependent oxidoreductase [Candidatus Cloacimonetes bacterium]|jgi:predicted Rossmann fold flavoprotein|nr:NAD(P)/FAD-dependent oxidoreductase [Candidatus Cloacimonadota bacterium]MBT6993840.1 NAD(P)/FAD-dependent oxidoreductase [Candidatus Cloacimonadota bacterium]MBT7469581.1 NAD(P)/FAD-dependent oxidoreductase [Candidatus Cloacimonadota bacterium]